MLKVESISAGYGEVPVLRDVSLQVGEGELVAIVGSNGAGKSTLLRVISGLLPATAGTIEYKDRQVTNLPSHEIVPMGLAHVLEGRHMFGKLSVMDNLLLGAYCEPSREEIEERLQLVFAMFPRLDERRGQTSETLSGGEQQMLAIARGLMSSPNLLMLDEPSLGLMPIFVKVVFDAVERIREEGVTVLLVEQNVRLALQVADRAYVLQTGTIVLEGTGAEMLHSDLVRKAYLGM
jgi:branched-chain amino acid transport system ATP-binding protein